MVVTHSILQGCEDPTIHPPNHQTALEHIHLCTQILQQTATYCNALQCTTYSSSLPPTRISRYVVAIISTLLKSVGIFCKRALYKRLYSIKVTYNFKEPTNRSHSIHISSMCRAVSSAFDAGLALTNTQQYTATLCYTQQHTATHSNTQQHTATHYITQQHTAPHSTMLSHTCRAVSPACTAAHTPTNTLQHTTPHCNTLQQTTPHYNTHTPIPPIHTSTYTHIAHLQSSLIGLHCSSHVDQLTPQPCNPIGTRQMCVCQLDDLLS